MHPLVPIFSLLVAASGWYYMFYSRAAANLGPLEDQRLNANRQRLRRVGGLCMFLLAVAFFAGFKADEHSDRRAFVLIWTAVLILLMTIVVLALLDLRMTAKLKKRQAERTRKTSDDE